MCIKKRVSSEYNAYLMAFNTAKKYEVGLKKIIADLKPEQRAGILSLAKSQGRIQLIEWIEAIK